MGTCEDPLGCQGEAISFETTDMEREKCNGYASRFAVCRSVQAEDTDGANFCTAWPSFWFYSSMAWKNLCGDPRFNLTWSEIDWLNSGVRNTIGAVEKSSRTSVNDLNNVPSTSFDKRPARPAKRKESCKHKQFRNCLLYTSPSPRDLSTSRMPSSA